MGKECLVVGVQPAITPTSGTSQFEPLDKQAGKFENRPLGPTISNRSSPEERFFPFKWLKGRVAVK
jgi:hypothetical protein